MAKIVLNRGHPVIDMFELLASKDLVELEFVVENAWQSTANAFQKSLTPFHPEYVRHQCDLIYRTNGFNDPAKAEQRLRQLLKDCEDTAQTTEISRLAILSTLGYNFMNSMEWEKALDIGQELEEHVQSEQDLDLLAYKIGGMEIQARAFNKQKMNLLAVKCLKKATQLIKEHWGEQDPWRIELMVLQENFLRESDEVKAAEDLKAEIQGITESIVPN
ncbi:hypothetical protein KHU50_011180 [Colletotrichum sp. SAR 10_65]|nr:hypothetical protein K4K51_002290 [Colletotrichum sp. SAR 10_75]KAI8194972.1 hypothetical protein KHU50_011180 [Colletotrichum sp. SAR 10_65]KAI8209295.1 hypothetical protein K4K52_000652 [Colletotrichum sp. SAR 10_76]